MKFDHFIIISITDFNKKMGDLLQSEIRDKCIKKIKFLKKNIQKDIKRILLVIQ